MLQTIILHLQFALKSIRSSLLRSLLTMAVIAIGIMALVSILTSIEGMKQYLISGLSSLGSNTFTIRTKGLGAHSRRPGETQDFPPITFEQAILFKERYQTQGWVSINTRASTSASVIRGNEKTNPNIVVIGCDENYLMVSGYKLKQGRNFSAHELETGFNSCLIGYTLWKRLYSKKDTLENSSVTIGNVRYRVIGVLAERGSSLIETDDVVLVTVNNARKVFRGSAAKFSISIGVEIPEQLDNAEEEARGVFRSVRSLRPAEADNFDIGRSDRLATSLIDNLKRVTLAAFVIGAITLIGAGIGLMNIMLVAVAERMREIGINKAIGANNLVVFFQFLTESVVICMMGGAFGILLGILAGNVVSILLEGNFIVPWNGIGIGFAFCFVIGLLAGLYPAIRAAKLDPIEALRYE